MTDSWGIFDGYVWCPVCNKPMAAATLGEARREAEAHEPVCSGVWMEFE